MQLILKNALITSHSHPPLKMQFYWVFSRKSSQLNILILFLNIVISLFFMDSVGFLRAG